MIGVALASAALADDAFVVEPFRDGVVVAAVWNERLDLWWVGPDGVRAHHSWPEPARVTNPSLGCGPRSCVLAWTTFEGRDPVGRASVVDPSAPEALALVDLGAATRVHAAPVGRGWRLLVESWDGNRRGDRAVAVVDLDRRGRPGSPAPLAGPVAPYTLSFDGDGVRYRAPGRDEAWLHEVPGAPPVAVEPIPLPFGGVCADGAAVGAEGCDPRGGESAAVARGRDGAVAWVTRDGVARVGVGAPDLAPAWSVELERLSRARASWVAKTTLFPMFEPGNDGREPFRVPILVRRVLDAEVTLRFEGPVSGVVTGSAPAPERARLRLAPDAGEVEAEPGEVWATTSGPPEAAYRSVDAELDASGLALVGACPPPTAVALHDHQLHLRFERIGGASLELDPLLALGSGVGADERGVTEVTGAWRSSCGLEGPQRLTVEWSFGPVLGEVRDEVGHQGMSLGF